MPSFSSSWSFQAPSNLRSCSLPCPKWPVPLFFRCPPSVRMPWEQDSRGRGVAFLQDGAAGNPHPWVCCQLPLLHQTFKRTYDKKAVDLYMLFNSELALVNRELSKKWPYLEPYMAQHSGQAHWVRILRRRIDRVMNVSLAFSRTCSRCGNGRVCRLSPVRGQEWGGGRGWGLPPESLPGEVS